MSKSATHAYRFGHRDTFCGIAVLKHPTQEGLVVARTKRPIRVSYVSRDVTCKNCWKCSE